MTTKRKRKYAQDFSGESKTQQHFKESCDVNRIVATFASTGVDPYAARAENKQFGFASAQSFSEAMQNVAEVNSAFAELPSETRTEFGNDPQAWLATQIEPEPTIDEIVDSEPTEEVSVEPEKAPEPTESEPK